MELFRCSVEFLQQNQYFIEEPHVYLPVCVTVFERGSSAEYWICLPSRPEDSLSERRKFLELAVQLACLSGSMLIGLRAHSHSSSGSNDLDACSSRPLSGLSISQLSLWEDVLQQREPGVGRLVMSPKYAAFLHRLEALPWLTERSSLQRRKSSVQWGDLLFKMQKFVFISATSFMLRTGLGL